jgi:16S rRNA processing protein RimM
LPTRDCLNAGQISGVFGVKGWVKVFSHTEPRENILRYSPWLLNKNHQVTAYKVLDGRRHGHSVVAELEGIEDRDAAIAVMGSDILIFRHQLPKAVEGEFYWADLIGLQVKTDNGIHLGTVDHLIETGANDVLIVKDGDIERLIPFLQSQTVLNIDLDGGFMTVDWDPDF